MSMLSTAKKNRKNILKKAVKNTPVTIDKVTSNPIDRFTAYIKAIQKGN